MFHKVLIVCLAIQLILGFPLIIQQLNKNGTKEKFVIQQEYPIGREGERKFPFCMFIISI